MNDGFSILMIIALVGCFILFWMLMFTKQDIKFLTQDVNKLSKIIEKVENDLRDIKYKYMYRKD